MSSRSNYRKDRQRLEYVVFPIELINRWWKCATTRGEDIRDWLQRTVEEACTREEDPATASVPPQPGLVNTLGDKDS